MLVAEQSEMVKAFWEFYHANPDVYAELLKLCHRLLEKGHKTYGIGSLFEALRWHMAMETTDPFYKLNNNHRAFYARLLMAREPELVDFFRTRASEADDIDLERSRPVKRDDAPAPRWQQLDPAEVAVLRRILKDAETGRKERSKALWCTEAAQKGDTFSVFVEGGKGGHSPTLGLIPERKSCTCQDWARNGGRLRWSGTPGDGEAVTVNACKHILALARYVLESQGGARPNTPSGQQRLF